MLEDAMAAFLSNDLPAVVVKSLQHVADFHRKNGDRCLMGLLYGVQHGPASTQAAGSRASICLSQQTMRFSVWQVSARQCF